ncbi:hypothetical protein [Nocardia sp. NPDC050175]
MVTFGGGRAGDEAGVRDQHLRTVLVGDRVAHDHEVAAEGLPEGP